MDIVDETDDDDLLSLLFIIVQIHDMLKNNNIRKQK